VAFVLTGVNEFTKTEHAMQAFTLIPHAILSIRFLLLICRIPASPLDRLLSRRLA
jgi:hypothetical protein